eukprot:2806305-Pleurochrysis_carterae.AAC.1
MEESSVVGRQQDGRCEVGESRGVDSKAQARRKGVAEYIGVAITTKGETYVDAAGAYAYALSMCVCSDA